MTSARPTIDSPREGLLPHPSMASPDLTPVGSEPNVAAMRVVVTALHGTFEPEAEWSFDGSSFFVNLKNGLKEHAAPVVRRCQWSAKNTFQARHDGQALLEKHVAAVEREFSGCPHF